MIQPVEPHVHGFYYHTVTLQIYVVDDYGFLVPRPNSMWYAPHMYAVLNP
jgi:hypothetical protein